MQLVLEAEESSHVWQDFLLQIRKLFDSEVVESRKYIKHMHI